MSDTLRQNLLDCLFQDNMWMLLRVDSAGWLVMPKLMTCIQQHCMVDKSRNMLSNSVKCGIP